MGDAVHIWSYFHDYSELDEQELLGSDELTRANNFFFQRDRNRFIKDRINLKKILSQYVRSNPKDMDVSIKENGKPYLKNSKIEFNISHSEDLSVYAVSKNEIGVDIEKIREIPNIEGIVKYFFTEKEAGQVKFSEGKQRNRIFLKIWTQKEAVGKMLGIGLGHLDENNSKYYVEDISPHNYYVGALAIGRMNLKLLMGANFNLFVRASSDM